MNRTDIALVTRRPQLLREVEEFLLDGGLIVQLLLSENVSGLTLSDRGVEMVVFDCSDPGIQGLRLCRSIRETFDGLFVLLSPPEEEQLTFLALQLGADLALSATSSPSLIAENLKSLYCRLVSPRGNDCEFGELRIDADKRDAFLAGSPVHLSTIEFELLWLLSRKAGTVISREAIHREIYKTSYNGYDRGIDLYISRIRRKIGDPPSAPMYLKTVRGVGYQFIGTVNGRTQ